MVTCRKQKKRYGIKTFILHFDKDEKSKSLHCTFTSWNPAFAAIRHISRAQLRSSCDVKVSSSGLSVCLRASLSFSLQLEWLNKKG